MMGHFGAIFYYLAYFGATFYLACISGILAKTFVSGVRIKLVAVK